MIVFLGLQEKSLHTTVPRAEINVSVESFKVDYTDNNKQLLKFHRNLVNVKLFIMILLKFAIF